MTKLDELVSFILSDKLKEIRNFECYDELVAEAQKLQREQVKNINYDTVLPTVFERGDVIIFCDEHYFVIENNGANGVVAPFGETYYLNTFWWEIGDDKCTFVRKATEKELSMLGLNCG